MLFNTPEFILLYLPIVFFIYFFLNRIRQILAGKVWLVLASLFFYAYWNLAYIPLLLGSIVFNFVLGRRLASNSQQAPLTPSLISRRTILTGSIAANLILLGYYKYTNFFVDNLNTTFGINYVVPQIILPLGISFFTFTQIAYLVDSYRHEVKKHGFVNYALFVTFFPHLIAGPILHHREMMTQFESRWTWAIRYRNIVVGLFIFSIGLFKKVVLADTFAIWANAGFDGAGKLDFFSAWATSLSYTFQLYFDFSGYCDMAIGASLLFNIWLPLNFNSPYKALNIQDFWRRWHMTLSRYLRDYLYIPLGGNRASPYRVYINLMLTFVLGGLWHGASWMFIIWGTLHGLALVIYQIWNNTGFRLPKVLAWLITFLFVNITWVFFRAKSMVDAKRVLSGMVDIKSAIHLPIETIPTANLAWAGWFADSLLAWFPVGLAANALTYLAIAVAFIITYQKNSFELAVNTTITTPRLFGALLLFGTAMHTSMVTASAVFLYFNF
jgi:alginate O-acetyltransferase complex protein AlgI